jgi:uncharacterized protein YbjT (DUF2867 family)/uncharacterized membrane protein YphA (DoxX/SURF4 family)
MRIRLMKILLTGANGFLGRYILAALLKAGHEVIPAVRNTAQMDRLVGHTISIHADFNRDIEEKIWLPRLSGVDAVINCAGILQGTATQSIEAIHDKTPRALFSACAQAGVKRVIQISAVSADADTAYARTKANADAFLATLDLDWTILRPSLVYAAGAYGGTALFRALAALPFFTPLIGKGEQLFQPIHIDDLCETILRVLAGHAPSRTGLEPVGPETITFRKILADLRQWLGYGVAREIELPVWSVAVIAKLGNVFGGTINTTALRQLEHGNVAPVEPFIETTGITPRRWRDALLQQPAQMQDRWAARLYFVRPTLRVALAATWIVSGLSGIMHRAELTGQFEALGITLTPFLTWMTCLLDVAVGAAVAVRWKPQWMVAIQLAIVIAYTIAITISAPELWLAPLGPILKNLPFLAAVLALGALEQER